MEFNLYLDSDEIFYKWRPYVMDKYFNGNDVGWLNKHPQRDEMLSEVYKAEPDLFANLSTYDDSAYFINSLRDAGIPFKILTSIGTVHHLPEQARHDKCLRFYEDFNVRSSDVITVMKSEDKRTFVKGKYCILVDDYHRNTSQWEDSGGTAILHTHGTHTFKETLERIKELYNEFSTSAVQGSTASNTATAIT